MKYILELMNSSLCHIEDVARFHKLDEEASDRLAAAVRELKDSINAVSRESDVMTLKKIIDYRA